MTYLGTYYDLLEHTSVQIPRDSLTTGKLAHVLHT